MPGRKPKPHHLKLVTGNPGRRPLGEAPPAIPGEVARPALLAAGNFAHADRAREIWDDLAPTLISLAILNPITAIQFGNWCEMQARYEADPMEFSASMIAQLRRLGACYGVDYVSFEKLCAGRGDEKAADPAAAYFG